MDEIYLDNSATTKPTKNVIKAINKTLKYNYGNPSSLHNKGLEVEKVLKKTRKTISKKLNVNSKEILFTSGGTEANNLAIKGIVENYKNRGKHLITTKIEHPAVLNVFKYLERNGFKVSYLDVNENGIISLSQLKNYITDNTILVSIMHVNNEIGSIQPIAKAARIVKEKNNLCFFHTDAIQSFGKLYINPKKWNIDLLTISGHKIHGPKGIGALYVRDKIELAPLILGGGQEKNIRSGTENTPGIAGLNAAIQNLPELNQKNKYNTTISELKNYFLQKLKENKENLPTFKINSPLDHRGAPHIVNLSFPGFRGEVIVHSLEKEGIYISTGSACHSRKKDKNNTLKEINLSDEMLKGTIRISLATYNNKSEIDYTINKLIKQLDFLSI